MLAVALTTVATVSPLTQAQAAADASVPASIKFLDEVYSLAWTSDPMPNYSKAEYLPKNEELPYYYNMLLLERLSGTSLTDVVRAQVSFLKGVNEDGGSDVSSKILNLFENPNTGEVMLVFLMSAPDGEREMIWEWNAYRYSPYTAANGQAGVRLFGLSVRHYGNDSSVYDFLEKLDVDNSNSKRINAVATAQLP